MTQMLTQRLAQLPQPEKSELVNALSPQVISILKRLAPEIGFLFDVIAQGAMSDDGRTGADTASSGVPPDASQRPATGPSSLPTSTTRLGGM